MTEEQINKRIHEIMVLCWHYWTFTGPKQGTFKCTKCGEFRNNPSSNFNFTGSWQTSAYEFGIMWEFMYEHEQWEEFRDRCGIIRDVGSWYIYEGVISPRPFAEAIVRFFEASHD